MKRIIKYLLAITLVCCIAFTTSSCSFMDSTDGKTIASITRVIEDGEVKLVITYEDDEIEPDKFTIPSGADGNGIDSIIVTDNEKGTGKIVEIKFTELEALPVYFELENGRGIKGIESIEEDGQIYMWLKYDDDTTSEKFLLPQGQDGVGFTGYDVEKNDDGSQTITFHFSQNTPDVVIDIPAPEVGNGIKSIYSTEDDENYILIINYTNGNSEDVTFAKPATPNQWYSGSSTPTSSYGNNGDYYFDTYHKIIYYKEYGYWSEIVSFDSEKTTCQIKFNLNDTDDDGAQAQMPTDSRTTYIVRKNTYFQTNGYGEIPVPTREGYIFKGWYRTKSPTSINAEFNDFTIILSDLELYAIWEKIA